MRTALILTGGALLAITAVVLYFLLMDGQKIIGGPPGY
jgi:hypothetical protein